MYQAVKIPFSRRSDRAWHSFLHYSYDVFIANELNLGSKGVTVALADDEVDSFADPTSIELQCKSDVDVSHGYRCPNVGDDKHRMRSISSPGTDIVDLAFGKGKDKLPNYLTSEHKFEYEFNNFFLLLGIISIILFILDMVSDVYLAIKYFEDGHFIFGIVTAVLVALPSLVMCCFGLYWYILDYEAEQLAMSYQPDNNEKDIYQPVNKTPRSLWIARILCTILQMGPLIRTIEYLYNGLMSVRSKLSQEEKFKYHRWMLYEDLDACLLRLFESFLEAAPQLIFQMYAWITLQPKEDVVWLSVRIAGLLLSWASLSISLVSYHKSLRYSRTESKNLSLIATPFYFIWRACEVGGRVICLAFFASVFQIWIFLPVLLHWVAVTIWIMLQRTKFHDKFCVEKIFNIICGYVMIFCFLNLRNEHTRFRYLWFYIVFYTENFCLLGLWFYYIPPTTSWYHVWGFFAVIALFVLHIIFQLVYYKFFHPKSLPMCLPWSENLCYESVCHSLPKDDVKKPHPTDQVVVVNGTGLENNTQQTQNNSHHQLVMSTEV